MFWFSRLDLYPVLKLKKKKKIQKNFQNVLQGQIRKKRMNINVAMILLDNSLSNGNQHLMLWRWLVSVTRYWAIFNLTW